MPPLKDSSKQDLSNMAGIPPNASEQRLMPSESTVYTVPSSPVMDTPAPVSSSMRNKKLIVGILCYVNLINYMDRYTVAGILSDIQETFQINSAQAGLLQTAFVLVYMVMAPTCGYLGDRFNRKYLMAFGVGFWSLTTLIGSFMPNYASFLVFRCAVGMGEASYSTIAPTIISDMFLANKRSRMLALFYFAIPVGSGLGYMVGATMKTIAHNLSQDPEAWRWGLRVTPVMGLVAVILILVFLTEPPRGEIEGGDHLEATSFFSDLKYLAFNKSYVMNTIAFTCVTFVAGALAWWGPLFVELGVEVQVAPNVNANNVAFIFGLIAMLAGLLGVPLGSFTGTTLRKRWGFADPLVCGIGLLVALPFLALAMHLASINSLASYFVVFFGQVFLNLNWAVVSDIVLYIIIPTRRSSAEAFQILFSHALGDAGSPYLVGVMQDAFRPMFANQTINGTTTDSMAGFATDLFNATTTVTPPDNKYADFLALQASLYICCLVLIIGAVFFFLNCMFIVQDKERADAAIAGDSENVKPKSNFPSQLTMTDDVSVIDMTPSGGFKDSFPMGLNLNADAKTENGVVCTSVKLYGNERY